MKSKACLALGVLAICGLAVAPLGAAKDAVPAKSAAAKAASVKGVRAPLPTGAAGSRTTSILGAAWKSDNSPIPNAKLRLRNVLTGRIEATTVANDMGQFAFTGIESGTYAIELVSDAGKILTLGHTFTVAPGETVATFVRLGTRVPYLNGIFGNNGVFTNTTAAATSTASSAGVSAIAPEEVRPASGRQ